MQDLHLLMLTMLIDLNESIKNKDLIKKSQGTNWVKRKQLRTGSRFFSPTYDRTEFNRRLSA